MCPCVTNGQAATGDRAGCTYTNRRCLPCEVAVLPKRHQPGRPRPSRRGPTAARAGCRVRPRPGTCCRTGTARRASEGSACGAHPVPGPVHRRADRVASTRRFRRAPGTWGIAPRVDISDAPGTTGPADGAGSGRECPKKSRAGDRTAALPGRPRPGGSQRNASPSVDAAALRRRFPDRSAGATRPGGGRTAHTNGTAKPLRIRGRAGNDVGSHHRRPAGH
jgi:hypothetical protein